MWSGGTREHYVSDRKLPSTNLRIVEDPGGIGHKEGCQYVKGRWLCGGGVASPTQEVGCVISIVVCGMSLMSWCAIETVLCVYGLPVVSQNLLENGYPWTTGWCHRGCVLAPANLFRALATTLLQQTWLNGRDLVPCICLSCGLWGPLPISLGCHLQWIISYWCRQPHRLGYNHSQDRLALWMSCLGHSNIVSHQPMPHASEGAAYNL